MLLGTPCGSIDPVSIQMGSDQRRPPILPRIQRNIGHNTHAEPNSHMGLDDVW